MGALDTPHIASALAIREAIASLLQTKEETETAVAASIIVANERLLSARPRYDLGSTLTVLGLEDKSFVVGHIGDNRLYHISANQIRCLTPDDSKLAHELGEPNPGIAAVKQSGGSKKLTKSLGEKRLGADDLFVSRVETTPGDLLILCSDGLWTEISDLELLRFALTPQSPQALANLLLSTAFERDNSDDVSVFVVRLH